MTYENALEVLKKYGQEHVLAYYDELNDEEKQSLLSQIEEIDFSIFDVLKEKESDGKEGMITPTEVLTLDTIKDYEFAYKVLGETAIQKGQLALVMLAGGHIQYRVDERALYIRMSGENDPDCCEDTWTMDPSLYHDQ